MKDITDTIKQSHPINTDLIKSIVGKNKEEAFKQLEINKIKYRIVATDKSKQFSSTDFMTDRVNLYIEDDKIKNSYIG